MPSALPCIFRVQTDSAVALSGHWPQNPQTWIHVAFTEAIKSPVPSSAIRLTEGQVWASKHTAARWTAILIQTSDGCRLHLVGPADAFICVYFFSSHGCLKLTYSIPHSARLQREFQLVNPVRCYNLVRFDASWFIPACVLLCLFCNGNWAGLVAHCWFVLSLQCCAFTLCAECIYI